MYSNKINVLELLALLKLHHVTSVVLCPGSRNIPLVQSMANDQDFNCYSITDERSAGFFALGLALKLKQPVAVCCTSGSALLNLHPAVSEAFYQQVPLLVISADRPVAWVGQMDGQTLPQAHVFGSLVKHSVDLPEVKDKQDLWYCNRLINEALLALNFQTSGPVQINVPISEPFFSFEVTNLPKARCIRRYEPYQFVSLVEQLLTGGESPLNSCLASPLPSSQVSPALSPKVAPVAASSLSDLAVSSTVGGNAVASPVSTVSSDSSILARSVALKDSYSPNSALVEACRLLLCRYSKIMLIIGQNSFAQDLMQGLTLGEQQLIAEHVLLVEESLSNLGLDQTCDNIDRTLLLPQVQADTELCPQVLVTLGGHIISKRLKHYLRAHKPTMHWHIAPDGAVVDLYHCLSHILVCRPQEFMQALAQALSGLKAGKLSSQALASHMSQQAAGNEQRSALDTPKDLSCKTVNKVNEDNAVSEVGEVNAAKTSEATEQREVPSDLAATQLEGDKSLNTLNGASARARLRMPREFCYDNSSHVSSLSFVKQWLFYSQQVFAPSFAYSQMRAIGQVIESLPPNSVLHLANSSTVRYAQFFKLPKYQGDTQIKVFSNRGVNGIEGSLSTAIGFAAADRERLNFILIGDLSFFYDLNAVWNDHVSNNVRILLLNNSGGEIFHALPNLQLTERGQHFVTATHNTSAKGWVESQGFTYLSVHDQGELNVALDSFMRPLSAKLSDSDKSTKDSQESPRAMVLEVFTSQEDDTQMLKSYLKQLQVLQ